MEAEAVARVSERSEGLHLRVAWLCGAVLSLEGYDLAAVGYAVSALVDAWKVHSQVFTGVFTGGNVGLLVGSLCAGLLGDRLGSKSVLIGCMAAFGLFSLISAFVGSPLQLAGPRFLTGSGLGGGIPLAVALTSASSPVMIQGRLVILMCAGVPIGFAAGGLLISRLVGSFGWPSIFVAGGALLARRPKTGLTRPSANPTGRILPALTPESCFDSRQKI